MRLLVLAGTLLSLVLVIDGQPTTDCRITNTAGCKVVRDPIYLVLAPRKIRPQQVVNVFASMLKMEYPQVEIRVSVVKGNVEYAETKMIFDRAGSRVLQMLIPSSLTPGQYRLRVEGSLGGEGYIFRNETDIEFDQKRASIFIQMSKPVYRQGQTVRFRVIPILPNMMPSHGSMTIYVVDPSGFAVRRWLGQQTNAGGFVNQSIELADQPTYGNWSIRVNAFGYDYERQFEVLEFWMPRFDVNVTVPPYVMDNVDGIRGIVMANHTSGRAVIGNATITVSIVPPDGEYDWQNPWRYPNIQQTVDYFEGRINIFFSREDLLSKAQRNSMENMEFIFNVTVYDWYLALERPGYGSTFCYTSRIKLKWVGDAIRTFKPGSVFVATVAVMREDGTPIQDMTRGITVTPTISGSLGSGSRNPVLKYPLNGLATFAFEADLDTTSIRLLASYEGESLSSRPIELLAYKYKSPSNSYISVTTSTQHPRVNQYMIFHVKTSIYVPKIYYQIVSQGNILIGDELNMISRQKTFSIALSRDMVPSARILVYYIRQPEEIVVDVLNFFVNGTRLNPVSIRFNMGKDFTRHTVEVNAFSDPGSYAAFSAIPYDLYARGLNDGISENQVIDELLTYDYPANGSYLHKWRINENEFQYNFFSSNGYGVDANKTFYHAGLTVLTDAEVVRVGVICEDSGQLPCFDDTNCYANTSRCDRTKDCPNDGADEQGCIYEEENRNRRAPLDRISHVTRFYDDSSWIWMEKWIKPDGENDFRVNVPRYPLTWVVNGFSLSQNKGFGMVERPVRYDATRLMYIQVEAPVYVVRGEQIGFRVTVFNYWFDDDYLEVLVKLHGSPNYQFVHVQEYGIVSSYSPQVSSGDHETIVFLEPGQSQDIYMPVIPTKWNDDQVDVTISATSYLSSDVVTKTLYVKYDGVTNYYHTPYLVDLITKGSVIIPDLNVIVPESFIYPETREHLYVPGSAKALVSVFGDVVTPGFFEEFLTAENVLRRPYGSAEGNMFNFAYNLLTLRFKKDSQQLSDDILKRTLRYMNVAYQRQLSYMTEDGAFKMFRDDKEPSIWLTAFVAKTLYEARFGEWEQDLFIPIELINNMVLWMCRQQNESGAFNETNFSPVYDRKMVKMTDQLIHLYNDPIPLTAYVLIALQKIEDVTEDAQSCIETARQRAASYLTNEVDKIDGDVDTFHLAITAYALSLTQEKSRTAYDRLYTKARTEEEKYWADERVPPNPSDIQNTVRYLGPRVELINDAYAVQTTGYALMSLISHAGWKYERDSVMRWLSSMRNYNGGFVSTQDSIVAMEALIAFTKVDPNRNVFDMNINLESTATPNWKAFSILTRTNYTNLQLSSLPNVWGLVQVNAQGTGRAMLQLSVSVNVEWPWLQKEPPVQSFDVEIDNFNWGGRNNSMVEMTACARWRYTSKSLRSGLAVMEVDIPTGFVVMNDTLRTYVQRRYVSNLKRAESYYRKVVFYFEYLDESKTCVRFRADRWFPVANSTIQHQIRVYDYYEPGLHNTTLYSTYNLFNLNLCYVCGSFQCPYCPTFNAAVMLKASFTLFSIVIAYLTHRYLLRT